MFKVKLNRFDCERNVYRMWNCWETIPASVGGAIVKLRKIVKVQLEGREPSGRVVCMK